MSLYDILSSPSDCEVKSEMEMDMSLDYNTSDLMSSDFFDSVLALSEGNLSSPSGIPDNVEDDVNMFSIGVFSPESMSSDSDKGSIHQESTDESLPALSEIDGIDENLLMSLLEPPKSIVNNTKIQNSIVSSSDKQVKPTKIVIQNPNNKKIIVTKPILNATPFKPVNQKTKKVIKLHTVAGNGRSVLLPFNVKSIKILNPNEIRTETINISSSVDSSIAHCKFETESFSAQSDEDDTDDVDVVSSTESQYPALHLTSEEKRLLSKEGIQLPAHYPLTKNEERELKRIRRKIRNKISAQDSRKRKKEYVDGLEERVKRSSEEKKYLLQRIKQLERQNNKLMSHFSKLQALIFKSSTSKATPSTCVMIVLLSALLVSLPNIRLPQRQLNEVEQGARRALLSSNVDEDIHMEEFLVFKDGAEADIEMDGENITEKELSKILESSDKSWLGNENLFDKMLKSVEGWLNIDADQNREFVEPEIDDDMPPIKRTRFDLITDSDVEHKLPPEPNIATITTTNFGIKDTKNK